MPTEPVAAGRRYIPPPQIETIRRRIPIERFAASLAELTVSGSELVGLCPLPGHDDSSPSFSVSPARQVFFCHGCKRGGDLFALAEHLWSCDFYEAARRLSELSGSALPQPIQQPVLPRPAERIALSDYHRRALEWLADYYAGKRPDRMLDYLRSRSLSIQAATSHGIGYAPASYLDDLPAQHHDALGDLSLLIDRDQRTFTLFRDAVVFPVHLDGDLVGFVGRQLSSLGSTTYLNTAGLPEGALLGLERAIDGIACRREIVLVEGPFDLLAATTAGVSNVAALLGSSLRRSHIRRIKDLGARRVILALDADSAGRAAAARAESLLARSSMRPHRIDLPDSLDPAKLLSTQGCQALRNALRSS